MKTKVILVSLRPECFELWSGLTQNPENINRIRHLEDYSKLNLNRCKIVVLDQSAVSDTQIIAASSRLRLDIVVVTGKAIDVPMAVAVTRNGAIVYSDELEPDDNYAFIKRKLKEKTALLEEYRALECRFVRVTERERAVLRLILKGYPNKAVAKSLNVAERTVEQRRANLYQKLEMDNPCELVLRLGRYKTLLEFFEPDDPHNYFQIEKRSDFPKIDPLSFLRGGS